MAKATNPQAIELIYNFLDESYFFGITTDLERLMLAELWNDDPWYCYRVSKLVEAMVEVKMIVLNVETGELSAEFLFDDKQKKVKIELANILAKKGYKPQSAQLPHLSPKVAQIGLQGREEPVQRAQTLAGFEHLILNTKVISHQSVWRNPVKGLTNGRLLVFLVNLYCALINANSAVCQFGSNTHSISAS